MTAPSAPSTCEPCGWPILSDRQLRKAPDLRRIYRTRKREGLCNTCYMAAYNDRQTTPPRPIEDVIEDVEWLLGTDTPQSIAARVGAPTMDALERRLSRHGRHDLARHFDYRDDRAVAS